ncbi:MAG: dTDP-4-dehydrorhamnose reductase [Rhodobacter sp.]|jgi:dTDP-4-dehydrorhamnose reductase|nr:dTDP-4-dehydrorhamnose reductase [Rhodobacter sp.]
MRVLLLGPNGQLGSDIRAANAALPAPFDLTPIGRDRLELSNLDAAIAALSDLTFDAIINATGYHKTDEVESNAQLAFTINAHLVKRLAELCLSRKARLFHISTDYVFGGQAKRQPLLEDDPRAPLNVYGASKCVGEDLGLMTGADVTVLRVASLFGVVGASGKGGNFVETMIRLGRERGALRVVDDQIMSPTSTADAARALLQLLVASASGGVYHLVNTGEVSWCGFAKRIIERMGIAASVEPVPTTEMPTPAKRPPYSALNNAKLSSVIGAIRDWDSALGDYLMLKHGRHKA